MNNKLTITAREMLLETMNDHFISLKKDISDDILILKLSFLYNQKINDVNTNDLDDVFSHIATKIDNILNDTNLVMKESILEVCNMFP